MSERSSHDFDATVFVALHKVGKHTECVRNIVVLVFAAHRVSGQEIHRGSVFLVVFRFVEEQTVQFDERRIGYDARFLVRLRPFRCDVREAALFAHSLLNRFGNTTCATVRLKAARLDLPADKRFDQTSIGMTQ